MLKKLLVFVALIISFSFLTDPVSAVYVTHKNSYISQNQTINEDVIIASDHVTIEGTVNGNVYVVGGTVVVNGTVNGTVFATGKNVEIGGFIRDNLVVAAGNVSVGTNPANQGGFIFGTQKIQASPSQ